jgi:acetyl esterase
MSTIFEINSWRMQMPLDSDSAALVDKLAELALPRYETLTPDQARSAMAAARRAAAIEPPMVGSVRDLEIPAPHGRIPARLYRPLNAHGQTPALVFFHGGGWVLGDLDSHDILCRRLANAGGCAVLAVDYRLAPENKFPAAIEDAITATHWTFANAQMLDIDPDRIAVGGDSAGANLAAVVSHFARDEGKPRIRLQLLIYPVTELAFSHPSHQLKEDHLPVLGETMVWFREHYLSSPEHQQDWRASPLLAKSFSALAPAYVLTVGYDPLSDEGAAYAGKLEQAGVKTTHRHFPGQIHGFLTMGVAFPTTKLAISEIGQALQESLANMVS